VTGSDETGQGHAARSSWFPRVSRSCACQCHVSQALFSIKWEWLRHAPAALYPRERPGTHCTGGWVGHRADLDRCEKSRPHRDWIPDRPARSSVTIATELPGPQNGLWSWFCRCKLNTNVGSLLYIFVPRVILIHDINVLSKINGAPPGIRMSFSFLLFSRPGTNVGMICGQE